MKISLRILISKKYVDYYPTKVKRNTIYNIRSFYKIKGIKPQGPSDRHGRASPEPNNRNRPKGRGIKSVSR